MNVLVVDDDQLHVDTLKAMLEAVEPSMQVYTDIKDIDKDIDVILLDIYMPENDGRTLCARLNSQEETKDIPILMLTASSLPTDIESSYAAGALDYIQKPIPTEILVRKIQRYGSLRRIIRASKALSASFD